MKTFIVFFAALIVTTTITASPSGWGSPPSNPSILVDLTAGVSAIGEGAAQADQQLVEAVSGDVNVPGNIDSLSGVGAVVGSLEEINQVALVNQPAESSSTLQTVNVNQGAGAGDGVVNTTLSGANLALAEISGGSSVSGSGQIAEIATTINQISSRKQ